MALKQFFREWAIIRITLRFVTALLSLSYSNVFENGVIYCLNKVQPPLLLPYFLRSYPLPIDGHLLLAHNQISDISPRMRFHQSVPIPSPRQTVLSITCSIYLEIEKSCCFSIFSFLFFSISQTYGFWTSKVAQLCGTQKVLGARNARISYVTMDVTISVP